MDLQLQYDAALQDRGHLSTSFTLENEPTSYSFRAYTNLSDWLNSLSAIGEYKIAWHLYANGASLLAGSFSQVWFHQHYGVRDLGNLPDRLCSCSLIDNFTARKGPNTASLNFTPTNNMTQYGEGFYWVAFGPFVVEVTGKTPSNLGGWALEAGVGLGLLPVSYYATTEISKRRAQA